jgi:hypothetical protein
MTLVCLKLLQEKVLPTLLAIFMLCLGCRAFEDNMASCYVLEFYFPVSPPQGFYLLFPYVLDRL